jgi:hypothetical protein
MKQIPLSVSEAIKCAGHRWMATRQLHQRAHQGHEPWNSRVEGWNGPWIEDLWLEHWKERWAAGADTGDRIYIPVLWINCYFKCDKPRKQEMLQYLTTLKPEYSYMSVYMMVSQVISEQCT